MSLSSSSSSSSSSVAKSSSRKLTVAMDKSRSASSSASSSSSSTSSRREKSRHMSSLQAPASWGDSPSGDRRSRRLSIGDAKEGDSQLEGKRSDSAGRKSTPEESPKKSSSESRKSRHSNHRAKKKEKQKSCSRDPTGGEEKQTVRNRTSSTSRAGSDNLSLSASPASPSTLAAGSGSSIKVGVLSEANTSLASALASPSRHKKPVIRDDPYIGTDATSEPLRIVAQKRYAQKMIAVGPGLRASPRVRRSSSGGGNKFSSQPTSPSSSGANTPLFTRRRSSGSSGSYSSSCSEDECGDVSAIDLTLSHSEVVPTNLDDAHEQSSSSKRADPRSRTIRGTSDES
eukprot:INCI11110.1.p1 GENE.INCI11110.1~~INCI11110.1.p1  ORF type:complete len:343 (+),score=49.41 INCI11110.1:192-1220(+)